MNWNRKNIVCLGLALLLGLATTASAGSLYGRTRLELGAGFRHHDNPTRTTIHWDDGVFHSSSTGTIGRLGVSYFADENLAYGISYTVHDVETDSWYDYYGYEIDETTIVHSVMFNLRFYLGQPRPYTTVRPYFTVGAGPFIGTTEYREEDVCDCETYSEIDNLTVFGAHLGGGVDFQMGRSFMLGFTGGYNFVDEFPYPVGGRRDYTGSEFGVSFSYLFGRGRR